MKPFTFHKTNQTAGFTLIEVLVVVIITGILAAIAAPGWLAFLNRQRVSAVESDLIQTLKNTQQDAIQRRQTRQIKVITAATVPTIEVGPLGTTGISQTLGSDVSSRGNISLSAFRFRPNGTKDPAVVDTIVFDYRGQPTDQVNLPFVITITSGQATTKQCVIVANLLGSLKTASNAECDNPQVN